MQKQSNRASDHYDYILAGAGGAGLSLALHMIESDALGDRRILLVDRDLKERNDRTWCFWSTEPHPWAQIAYRSWDRLRFIGGGKDMDLRLAPYRYQLIRSGDFYRYALDRLAACPMVDLLHAEVDTVRDEGARVALDVRRAPDAGGSGAQAGGSGAQAGGSGAHAGGSAPASRTGSPAHAAPRSPGGFFAALDRPRTFTASYLFDSTYDSGRFYGQQTVDESKYHNLKQHFLGRLIRAPRDTFEVDRATMFDFRTPQDGVMRFVYTMPLSEREALVEYTLFSHDLLPPHEYGERLDDYIRDFTGLEEWECVEEESCIIPMTDYPFERRPSPRVLNIGTKGGRVKASTGYAFTRMQRDAKNITLSLEMHDHPFDIPESPGRYRFFDSVLLQVLYRHGERAEEVFTDLFAKNPVQRIFRFLDEEDGVWGNLKLMSTVPVPLFLRAAARVISGTAP